MQTEDLSSLEVVLCDGKALDDVIVSEGIWKCTVAGSNHCEWQLLTKAAVGLGPSTGSAVMGMGKHSVGRFVLCPPLKREKWVRLLSIFRCL